MGRTRPFNYSERAGRFFYPDKGYGGKPGSLQRFSCGRPDLEPGPQAGRLSDPRVFFSCVIVAGIFGAVTAKPSILFVQAVPAIVALLATILTMSLSLYVRRITSPRNYSSRYCHVSAPSKVLIRRPAMSSGAIILALTAILLSASFSISS